MMAEAAALDELQTWQWITKGEIIGPDLSLMWGLRLEQVRTDECETLNRNSINKNKHFLKGCTIMVRENSYKKTLKSVSACIC